MITKVEKRHRERGGLLNKDNQYKTGLIIWTQFWRANLHRFIQDYFGCTELKIFQNILLWLMSKNIMFCYIASRGQGKSLIVSWFAVAYACLYPSVEIVITSGTKGQAKMLVSSKIEKFAEKYPNLKKEILKITKSQNDVIVFFKNGSTITCVAPNDNSRGLRGNILIIDKNLSRYVEIYIRNRAKSVEVEIPTPR